MLSGPDTKEEVLRGLSKRNHNERNTKLVFILSSSFVCLLSRLRAVLLGLLSFPSKLFLFLTFNALWMDSLKSKHLSPLSKKRLTTQWGAMHDFQPSPRCFFLLQRYPTTWKVLIQEHQPWHVTKRMWLGKWWFLDAALAHGLQLRDQHGCIFWSQYVGDRGTGRWWGKTLK